MKKPGFALGTICLTLGAALVGCGKKDAPAPAPTAAPSVTAPAVQAETALTRAQIEAGSLEPTCSVESVVDLATEKAFPIADAVYTMPKDKAVKLIGFATLKSKGEVLGSFTAYLASTSAVYKVAGQTELERPDVVGFFSAPGMLKSGFHINTDLKGMPPGDYAVYLRAASGATCPTHHTLRIQ